MNNDYGYTIIDKHTNRAIPYKPTSGSSTQDQIWDTQGRDRNEALAEFHQRKANLKPAPVRRQRTLSAVERFDLERRQ